jgi:metal-responsive CopG/Arc/MetJ family transcriptional regulator
MATIQVVLDDKLLKETNNAAKQAKQNRSELVRTALREFLKKQRIREMEQRDRRGYQSKPIAQDEFPDWEAEAAWPED